MNDVLIWVIVAIALAVVVAVIAVVVVKKRSHSGPEPVVDPPYDRKGVDDPTVDDPQLAPGVEPDGARFVEDPSAVRNTSIDDQPPGQSLPRSYPSPGPSREQ